ncbi:potassium-transporting ATPase subunit KdpC [Mucilaginibacter aquatilis]|uniref:Potassium-transporting ATPase KdpC subunit n=1 Tax=Mucilaginibacter aquatilis TaxID=1517760 RepID=A0A6I4I6C3_9SPHI|nr:potassium-transporting ATPase subunit KdpC [Mucilaginibacter aquatilis]MVN90622.1 potassium-transporting ATPase subunit KdpC [Mucilaginibacter aquatilis]
MKKYIIQSIRLTVALTALLCVLYPVIVAFIGKFSNGAGNGQTIMVNGKVVGYAAIGQKFDKPQYFWGRPSAVDYNAAGSAGSNKGATNADYLKQVSDRVDTLLKHHPYIKKADIPADMVTASGSGLDPDISAQGAAIQIQRVAQVRGLSVASVTKLVQDHTEKPVFGPAKVNVLKLNVALNELKR